MGQDGVKGRARVEGLPRGAFGFGGQTTQQVLYELLQLYVEQGCRGTQIQFGTPRGLLLRIWPEARNPSAKDYARLRRDLDILRGYDFHCTKRLLGSKAPRLCGHALAALRRRLLLQAAPGTLRTGRASVWLHRGKPRAPADRSHPRFLLSGVQFRPLPFAETSRAALGPLPLEEVHVAGPPSALRQGSRASAADRSNTPRNVRTILAKLPRVFSTDGVPTLKSYRFEKSPRTGEWLIVFERDVKPKQEYRLPNARALPRSRDRAFGQRHRARDRKPRRRSLVDEVRGGSRAGPGDPRSEPAQGRAGGNEDNSKCRRPSDEDLERPGEASQASDPLIMEQRKP